VAKNENMQVALISTLEEIPLSRDIPWSHMTDLMNYLHGLKDLLSDLPMEKDQEHALNRIRDKAMKVRPIASKYLGFYLGSPIGD
jgi:hypothetical protein